MLISFIVSEADIENSIYSFFIKKVAEFLHFSF